MSTLQNNAAKGNAGAVGHTPGPWEIRPNDAERWNNNFGEVCAVYNTDTPTHIAVIGSRNVGPIEPSQHTADARLIAAAPDLLDACKLAQDRVCEGTCGPFPTVHSTLCSALRAAVAKAEKGGQQA